MTVKELIEELQKYDGDLTVVINSGERSAFAEVVTKEWLFMLAMKTSSTTTGEFILIGGC